MNRCRSLEFAPTAPTILLAQTRNFSDRTVNGDRFNIGNIADDLKHVYHGI